jgi:hypothetical protein
MPQRKKVDFALTRRRSHNFKLPESKTLEATVTPQREGPAVETGGILRPRTGGPFLVSGCRSEACVSRFRAVAARNA